MPDSTTMEMFRVLAQQSQHVANMIEMQATLIAEGNENISKAEAFKVRDAIRSEQVKVIELTRKAKALYQGN